MGVFKRFGATVGVLGLLSVGAVGTATAAVAAGGPSCEPGSPSGPNSISHSGAVAAASDFSTVSGTTETDIFLTGVDTVSGSIAYLQIEVFDPETQTFFVDALGCTANPDFQIDQTLTGATLAPTVFTMVDSISGNHSTATVTGAWTGTGDRTHTTQTSHYHSGRFTNIFNFIGFDRLADATATVSDPGIGVSFSGAAFSAGLDKTNVVFIFVCAAGGC